MTDRRGWTDGGIHEIPLPDEVSGRLWLCGKHHIAPRVDEVLSVNGADVVVCLNRREELVDRWPGYVAWLESETSVGTQRAIWHPIHDLSAPPVSEMRTLARILAVRLRSGDGVIVHCAAGVGRAGTTAVSLLVTLGVPLDEALRTVREHRPMAGPEVGAQLDLVRTLAASK